MCVVCRKVGKEGWIVGGYVKGLMYGLDQGGWSPSRWIFILRRSMSSCSFGEAHRLTSFSRHLAAAAASSPAASFAPRSLLLLLPLLLLPLLLLLRRSRSLTRSGSATKVSVKSACVAAIAANSSSTLAAGRGITSKQPDITYRGG